MQTKSPHHRRQHGLRVAGVVTAFAFVVWITTLSLRFGPSSSGGQVAGVGETDSDVQQTQLAGVDGSSDTSQTGIEVVGTSTDSGYSDYQDATQ